MVLVSYSLVNAQLQMSSEKNSGRAEPWFRAFYRANPYNIKKDRSAGKIVVK